MVALGGEAQSGFAVAGSGVEVSAMVEEELDDFEMAIGGSGEEGRVARAVTIIGVGTALEEPSDNFGVAAGDGASKGVIAGAVGGRSIDVRAMFGEVACHRKMTEDGGQSNNGKAVGRKGA